MIHIEFTYRRWRTLANDVKQPYDHRVVISYESREGAQVAVKAAEEDPSCKSYRVVER